MHPADGPGPRIPSPGLAIAGIWAIVITAVALAVARWFG